MLLAGIPIRDEDVFKLAGLLRTGALDEPPTDALAELRGVLLAEHEWRVRERLV